MKISIVTPSFNQKKHLRSTIESVLNQENSSLEYIVIDGGSSDGSADIIQEYNSRLSYWCSEPDRGQYDAINKGFSKSTGEIMGWLNSSDVYMPWTLQTVEDIFKRFPNVQWISSMRKVCITEEGVFDGMVELAGFSGKRMVNGLHGGPGNGDYIQQETCFWRRGLWEQIGGKITDRYKYAADFWLWSEFFKKTRCTGIESPLAAFRYHENQRSGEDLYGKEMIQIMGELRSEEAQAFMVPGFQNVIRYWTTNPDGITGKSTPKIISYYDDRFYSVILYWRSFFNRIIWPLCTLTYFPVAAYYFVRRGFRRCPKDDQV